MRVRADLPIRLRPSQARANEGRSLAGLLYNFRFGQRDGTHMYKFFRSLFFRKPDECFASVRTVDDDMEADPAMRECIERAFRTGNIVIGNRNADGTVTITEQAAAVRTKPCE